MFRELTKATHDGVPWNNCSRCAGLHRNDGHALDGLGPAETAPPAASPIYGDGSHDPQRPRDITLGSACSSSVKVGPEAVAGLTPDGTVDMNQVQVAYIGNAGGGSGTLYYHGNSYPFTVGGLGVGGIGASTVDAEGEVYKLHNISQFAGSYGQASYGFVVGTTSGGDLWMQNEAGVIMHLKAKRTGLMLSLGGDAVVISMR